MHNCDRGEKAEGEREDGVGRRWKRMLRRGGDERRDKHKRRKRI
jgi:hypothetical protein